MKYLRHLDGLRAVAVLPVVAYHISPNLLPGGYVGVDIFFVISGFLITQILYRDLESNNYSLLEFYKKRILRLVPALVAVCVAVFVVTLAYSLPNERQVTGMTMVSAAAFVSNIFLFFQADYFAPDAETNPLLHTWSLAVEEQFYIFFPLLLSLCFHHGRRHLIFIFALLCMGSLIAATLWLFYSPVASFYLLPFRAWELGVGAILALLVIKSSSLFNGHHYLAVIGSVMLIAGYGFLNKNSLFPGVGALLPCLGAVLIIAYGANGLVGAVLGNSVFVWFGKISYSLYLWHWPVIVFWRLQGGTEISFLAGISLFGISTLLAATSTYLIEKPFRDRGVKWAARKVVPLGLVALALTGAAGYLVSQNWFQLKPLPVGVAAALGIAEYRDTEDYKQQFTRGTCFLAQGEGGSERIESSNCVRFSQDGYPNILVLGDSHAAQYWLAIKEAFPSYQVGQVTSSGCRAVLNGVGATGCKKLRSWVFESLIPKGEIDFVVLAGRWSVDDLSHLKETLEYLKNQNIKVVLFGPVPEYHGTLPFLLARSMLNDEAFDFDRYFDASRNAINQNVASIASNAEVAFIDVIGDLCSKSGCSLVDGAGLPIQFDYGHLTLTAARDVVNRNRSIISNIIQSQYERK